MQKAGKTTYGMMLNAIMDKMFLAQVDRISDACIECLQFVLIRGKEVLVQNYGLEKVHDLSIPNT